MSAVFTPKRMRITTERYQKMVATGVLTSSDRVELIEGEIIDMAPIGTKHTALTGKLNQLLVLALGKTAIVMPGCPVNLGEFSEPQPDIAILKPRPDFYAGKLPEAADVLLLIEVSDSSLAFDQGGKRDLYARYGVSEYWVVDVNSRRVVVYLDPAQGTFRRTHEYRGGDTVSPRAFPNFKIAVDELFA